MYQPKDHISQLAEYIAGNLSKGYTLEALKYALLNQGYSKISVDNAIDLANKKLADKAPLMREKPQITYRVLDENDKIVAVRTQQPIKKSFFQKLFKRN